MANEPASQTETTAPKPGSRPPLTVAEVKEYVDKRYEQDKDLRAEWGVFRGYYENDYWSDSALEEHESRVTANYFFSNISQILPLMTDQRPIWHMRSRYAFLQPLMTHWNEALYYQWFRQHMDMKVPMAYLDALVSETGFFKVTWDPDANELRGDLRVDVVDPKYMVFAGGYDELDDCPWVGQIKQQPLSWVRDNYPEEGRSVLPDSKAGDEKARPEAIGEFAARNEWVTIYEIWLKDDRAEESIKEQASRERTRQDTPHGAAVIKKNRFKTGRIITFAKQGKGGGPVLLEDVESPYRHGRSPYVPVYNYRKQHQVWGIGECRQIRTLVMELQKTLQQLAHHVHNYTKPNWEVDTDIQNLDHVQDTFHKGGHMYPRKGRIDGKDTPGIRAIQPEPPPRQLFDWVRAMVDIIEEISGVTELSKGVQEKRARQTAQEISTIIETSYTRSRQRVRNLEWSIEQVATRMGEVMMQNYDQEREFSSRAEDNSLDFGTISNSKQFAERFIRDRAEEGRPGPLARKTVQRDQDKKIIEQRDADLAQLQKMFGDVDQVLALFDIEVQSNSMLPMDKQSLANMALRLVQMEVIDREAALDTLNFPNRKMIVDRMKEREEQLAKAKAGATGGQQRQQGPAGTPLARDNALDVSDQTRGLVTANGSGG